MNPNLDLKQKKKKLVHTSAPTQLKSCLRPYLFPTKRMGALEIKEFHPITLVTYWSLQDFGQCVS
jgi:hypothetical protein